MLDTRRDRLTLIYESPGTDELDSPDNLVVMPTGDLLLCEDGAEPSQFLRVVTRQGKIFDFAESVTSPIEFAGACFDRRGRTLFVSQQGDRENEKAVTYAIWGPWER